MFLTRVGYSGWLSVWQAFKNQYDSLLLAAGVVAGGGCFWAFAVPGVGVAAWVPFIVLILGTLGIYAGWKRGLWWAALGVMLGFGSAWGWVAWQRTQALPAWAVREGETVWVIGKIDAFGERDNGRRAVDMRPAVVVAAQGMVREVSGVRVTVAAARTRDLAVGDGVALEAQLFGPSGPKFEGDRDDRWPWFFADGRWLVKGYVKGKMEKTALPAGIAWEREGWFGRQRREIIGHVGDRGRGVVAALLVGDSRAVPRDLYEAYRNSGLLHLLVISGLHMAIVAGSIFLLVRRGLLWLPFGAGTWLALYVPVRGVAALAALLGAAVFAALVGGQVSVLRAVLMVALGFGALLAGRGRETLRAWALVMVALLMVWPEWLLKPGFQLSFAAVLGLVLWGIGRGGMLMARGWLGKLQGIAESSVVASLATAPILAWHFGAVPVAGVAANMVAIPLMTVATWLGMASLALWPLGWQDVPLGAMERVVGVSNRVAEAAAAWPAALVRFGEPADRVEFAQDWGGVVKVGDDYYAWPDSRPWVVQAWERRWGRQVLWTDGGQ